MHTQRHEQFEPADKPVQFYELALCLVAQLVVFASLGTHNHVFELTATASVASLLALSLWKLFVPPRFSATRGAFVLISVLCVVVLGAP